MLTLLANIFELQDWLEHLVLTWCRILLMENGRGLCKSAFCNNSSLVSSVAMMTMIKTSTQKSFRVKTEKKIWVEEWFGLSLEAAEQWIRPLAFNQMEVAAVVLFSSQPRTSTLSSAQLSYLTTSKTSLYKIIAFCRSWLTNTVNHTLIQRFIWNYLIFKHKQLSKIYAQSAYILNIHLDLLKQGHVLVKLSEH